MEERNQVRTRTAEVLIEFLLDAISTFAWFVRNRFLPLKEANWKEETAKVKKHLIQKHLVGPFDQIPLEGFDKFTLQVHLNALAKTCCRDTVLQMRAYLRDIFAEAIEQDFLVKDPARKVAVPGQLRESDKTTLTWDRCVRRSAGWSSEIAS